MKRKYTKIRFTFGIKAESKKNKEKYEIKNSLINILATFTFRMCILCPVLHSFAQFFINCNSDNYLL